MFYYNTIITILFNNTIYSLFFSILSSSLLFSSKCICCSVSEYSRFDLCAICWHCFQFPPLPKNIQPFLALANNCIKLSTQKRAGRRHLIYIYILYIYIVYVCVSRMHKQIAVLTAAPENMQQIFAATT